MYSISIFWCCFGFVDIFILLFAKFLYSCSQIQGAIKVMYLCKPHFTFFFLFFFFSPQGYFFDREDSGSPGISSQAQEEALANDTASLGLLPETKFHPIRTAWIAILQLILFVSTSVS